MANSHCKFNDPDCENCPYDDCIATEMDVVRQNAYKRRQEIAERNRKIASLFKTGLQAEDIGRRYGLNKKTVYQIARRYAHG